MARRLSLMAVAMMAGLVVASCGSKPPAAPVQAPRASQPEQAAPAPVKSPELLARIMEAGWQLAQVKGLPPLETSYLDGGEGSGYAHLAYAGGALRLYLGPGKEVFALVADTSVPAYKEFAGLETGPGYSVVHADGYATVLRSETADPALVAALKAGPRSRAELVAAFGEPTYWMHVHGVGSQVLRYVPLGMDFESDGNQFKLAAADLPGLHKYVANSLVNVLKETEKLLATSGKPSPGGKYVAAHYNGGVYWIQYIVVKEPGKAEVRFGADYFIQDFCWLDDHRIVYAAMQMSGDEYEFLIGDAAARKLLPSIKVKDQVSAFGPAGAGKLWYQGKDGARHELTVP